MEDNQKSKKAEVHTVPNPKGGWSNKQDGKVVSQSDTKTDAQQLGREKAIHDKTEHRIHNKDGKITRSNSYGNDPYPPKG